MEIVILFLVISTILGYLIGRIFARTLFHLQYSIENAVHLKKYHIHHDLVGLLLIFSAKLFASASIQFIVAGLGLGLFIHHISAEGLKLITKR